MQDFYYRLSLCSHLPSITNEVVVYLLVIQDLKKKREGREA